MYTVYFNTNFTINIEFYKIVKMSKKTVFGLLGKNISYSFSKKYFTNKFNELGLSDYSYENFDMVSMDNFPLILNENINSLKGLNVTIPYKEDIFKYLDELDEDAREIGAVNTIKILDGFRLKGYNTDVYGFEKSLQPLLKSNIKYALILGTGGASKAIAYALKKLNISFLFVSRYPKNIETISYKEVDEKILNKFNLIINCTPLGTFPKIDEFPQIPYQFLNKKHLLFDLIYNPSVSKFLKKGREMGAKVKNGEQMLELQADKSWEIWSSK